MVSIEWLRENLRYAPELGGSCLQWIKKGPGRKFLSRAGYIRPEGYCQVKLLSTRTPRCYAHRIVWALHYGEWPSNILDHINGNRSDNRIENLRVCPKGNRDNQQNMKIHKNNRLKVQGVSPNQKGYRAQIQVDGRKINLGTFNTVEEASAAYQKAKRELHTFSPEVRK